MCDRMFAGAEHGQDNLQPGLMAQSLTLQSIPHTACVRKPWLQTCQVQQVFFLAFSDVHVLIQRGQGILANYFIP